MKQEKLGFGIVIRMLISLLPILFGMPSLAVILCAYNIAMSFVILGPLTSFVSALCAVCISMFITGTYGAEGEMAGLFLGLEAVLCSVGCVYCVVKKKSFFSGVWMSSLGYLIPSFLQLRYTAAMTGDSISQFMSRMVSEIFKAESQPLLAESPQLVDEALLQQLQQTLSGWITMLIPAILIIGSVLVGYIVMWAVCAHLRRVNFPVKHSFAHVRIPRTMIIILVLSAIFGYLDVNDYITVLTLNMCVVLSAFCWFSGISIVDFYIRKIVKRAVPRVFIHFLIFVIFFGVLSAAPFINIFTLYILLATIDSFVNLRKLSDDNGDGREKSEEERKN